MQGNGKRHNTFDRGVDEVGLVRLAGTVETIVYSNEENGYTVLDLECEGGELVTATGAMPYISEGDSVVLTGRWTHSPKYGRQFRVEQYEHSLPADTTSILRYLSSRTIKGIGPRLARRIVDAFGEDTFEVMENHRMAGRTGKGYFGSRWQWRPARSSRKSSERAAMLFFREWFGALTVKIYKRWGNEAVDVRKNPYVPARKLRASV